MGEDDGKHSYVCKKCRKPFMFDTLSRTGVKCERCDLANGSQRALEAVGATLEPTEPNTTNCVYR